MPILCFRNKIKVNDYEETISFAFNCYYDNDNHLKIKDLDEHFDSGDMRIKINEVINKLTYETLMEYDKKNKGVLHLALLNYFYDNIPELYSMKIESNSGDSIYYIDDLKKSDL